MKLKNTFILQNNNPSFDNYAVMMKKRKSTVDPSKLGNSSQKAKDTDDQGVKINQINPQARDGHVAVMHKNRMLIFGGDRHHMPFNDLFMLDLNDFFKGADYRSEAVKVDIKIDQQ